MLRRLLLRFCSIFDPEDDNDARDDIWGCVGRAWFVGGLEVTVSDTAKSRTRSPTLAKVCFGALVGGFSAETPSCRRDPAEGNFFNAAPLICSSRRF